MEEKEVIKDLLEVIELMQDQIIKLSTHCEAYSKYDFNYLRIINAKIKPLKVKYNLKTEDLVV